ncbi:MAG: type II toxin-antitoxin system VapC family toxin [Armatimonadota bacterium]
MKIAVDTSAYYALAAAEDINHAAARLIYERLLADAIELWTVSYVVAESAGLIGKRLGFDTLHAFRESLDESSSITWVDKALHVEAWNELERHGRRDLSLVDCSLAVGARREGIQDAFAFDRHFELLGLRLLR